MIIFQYSLLDVTACIYPEGRCLDAVSASRDFVNGRHATVSALQHSAVRFTLYHYDSIPQSPMRPKTAVSV